MKPALVRFFRRLAVLPLLVTGLAVALALGGCDGLGPKTCVDAGGIDPHEITLTSVGETADLDARYDGCQTYRDDALFVWSSSASDVATVNDTGLVTAVAEGEARIEALLTEEAAGTDFATEPRLSADVVVTVE